MILDPSLSANGLKVMNSLVFDLRLSLIRSKGGSDTDTLDSILHTIKRTWANVAFWLMCSAMVNTLKASEI